MANFARLHTVTRRMALVPITATALAALTLIPVTLHASASTSPTPAPQQQIGSTSAFAHVDLKSTCVADSAYLRVAGQGPICQAGSVSVVKLASGRHLQVAAPDTTAMLQPAAGAAATPAATAATTSSAASLDPSQCMTSAQQPHVELYYAHFQGESDNFGLLAPDIQQQFLAVDQDYISYYAVNWFGVSMHLIVQCDTMGEPQVHDITLSTRLDSANFSTIVSDMQAQGHCVASQGAACNAPGPVHYWVFTDGNPVAAYGYAGQSTVIGDDSPGAGNAINGADAYSVNYGYCLHAAPGTNACDPPYDNQGPGSGPGIFAHENGHALGAVQLSAPHSTGAWHCTDGTDVMCYNDGGPNASQYTSTDCGRGPNGTSPFDCGFNDYFNPSPAPGSYLAAHWDVASVNDGWLEFQRVATSTAVSALDYGVRGEPMTLTATVASSLPAGSPTGNVTFTDNGTTLGSAPLGAGGASLVTTSLPMGTDSIQASYGGSALYQPSTSTAITVTIGKILPTSGYHQVSGASAALMGPGCTCPHAAAIHSAPAAFRAASGSSDAVSPSSSAAPVAAAQPNTAVAGVSAGPRQATPGFADASITRPDAASAPLGAAVLSNGLGGQSVVLMLLPAAVFLVERSFRVVVQRRRKPSVRAHPSTTIVPDGSAKPAGAQGGSRAAPDTKTDSPIRTR